MTFWGQLHSGGAVSNAVYLHLYLIIYVFIYFGMDIQQNICLLKF